MPVTSARETLRQKLNCVLLRALPLLFALLVSALLLWVANDRARNAAGSAAAPLVQQFVSANVDDMPFGSGICPAPDPRAIARFIDGSRPLLKNALTPALISPLRRIELRIESIDGVAGEQADGVAAGAGRSWSGETSVTRADREIPVLYSIVAWPNRIVQSGLTLFLLAGALLFWRYIPAGLTRQQAEWFHALIDAGASSATARREVQHLAENDAWAPQRRRLFNVLTGIRQHPPESAFFEVFVIILQKFDGTAWNWAARLLADSSEPGEMIFEEVARLQPVDSAEHERRYEQLTSEPVEASSIDVFKLVFDPRYREFREGEWVWVERLLKKEPGKLREIFSAVAKCSDLSHRGRDSVFERLLSSAFNVPALDVFTLLLDREMQDFDEESWEWLDFALEYLLEDAGAEPSSDDFPVLWVRAIHIARVPLRVELIMNELKTGKSFLIVKGIRLRGFEQQGTLVYYGQYLYRRCVGEGWLQNPGGSTTQPELDTFAKELNVLVNEWSASDAMKGIVAERKPLADRLNNGRNLIRNAFREAFGDREHLQARFQFDEEVRGRLTAYRVKFSPEQIIIRPFPGAEPESQ